MSSDFGTLRDHAGSVILKLAREMAMKTVTISPKSHSASLIKLTTCSGRAFFSSFFCSALAAFKRSETLFGSVCAFVWL